MARRDHRNKWQIETNIYANKLLCKSMLEASFSEPSDDTRYAYALDTESTGLDPTVDDLYQISIVLFEYNTHDGSICRIVDSIDQYNDPDISVDGAERWVGYKESKAGLKGKSFDFDMLKSFVSTHEDAPILAHNSYHDFKFLAARTPLHVSIDRFFDTLKDIPWKSYGYENAAQVCLLYENGWEPSVGAHDALFDCYGILANMNAFDVAPNDVDGNAQRFMYGVDKKFYSKTGKIYEFRFYADNTYAGRKDMFRRLRNDGVSWNGNDSNQNMYYVFVGSKYDLNELAERDDDFKTHIEKCKNKTQKMLMMVPKC